MKDKLLIGFGTYRLVGEKCTQAVAEAIQCGYRIIDTATFYNNFEEIGRAIGEVKRSDLYLISKVWHDSVTALGIEKDIQFTLEQLKTDYLDLYLIHWPNSQISITETLTAMDDLRKQGKIKEIGMSNVTVNHLKRALEVGVPISWVQVEMHADYCNDDLISFCKENNIRMQAWRPLNKGKLVNDQMLASIGQNYGKSSSQVALRWIIQRGVVPLPGSSNSKHIQNNFNVFDFSLSQDEMDEISARAASGSPMRIKKEHGLGFEDEFDFTYEQCWPNL